jgi:hypothetical protein
VAILISDPIDCKPKAVKRVKKALDSGKVVNSARENNNSEYICTHYQSTQIYKANTDRPKGGERLQYNGLQSINEEATYVLGENIWTDTPDKGMIYKISKELPKLNSEKQKIDNCFK